MSPLSSVKISSRRKWLRTFFQSGGIFVPLLAVGGLLFFWIGGNSFRVQQLSISNNARIAAVSLWHLSDIHRGQHLLSINRSHVERQIKQHPWIRDAKLQLQFPSGVHIEVEEQKPVMMLAMGRFWYVNDAGEIFRESDSSDVDYPVLTGIPDGWDRTEPVIVQRILQEAVALLVDCSIPLVGGLRNLSEVHFDKHMGFSVVLRNGSEIIFGFYSPQSRIERLQKMVENGLDIEIPQRIELDADRVAIATPLFPKIDSSFE
jgi:hypothetical protein